MSENKAFKAWVDRYQIGPGTNDDAKGDLWYAFRCIFQDPAPWCRVVGLKPPKFKLSNYLNNRRIRLKLFIDLLSTKIQHRLHINRKLYTGRDGTVMPGWIPILDRLAADLIAMGWDRDLHQVKEKFGTLRFSIGKKTESMRDRIQKASMESSITCEKCGAPGTLGSGEKPSNRWLKTLCGPCHARREAGDRLWDEE